MSPCAQPSRGARADDSRSARGHRRRRRRCQALFHLQRTAVLGLGPRSLGNLGRNVASRRGRLSRRAEGHVTCIIKPRPRLPQLARTLRRCSSCGRRRKLDASPGQSTRWLPQGERIRGRSCSRRTDGRCTAAATVEAKSENRSAVRCLRWLSMAGAHCLRRRLVDCTPNRPGLDSWAGRHLDRRSSERGWPTVYPSGRQRAARRLAVRSARKSLLGLLDRHEARVSPPVSLSRRTG